MLLIPESKLAASLQVMVGGSPYIAMPFGELKFPGRLWERVQERDIPFPLSMFRLPDAGQFPKKRGVLGGKQIPNLQI
jgi:hypothetical protein